MNDLELYIKFYKSPIGKQNIWIEKLGEDGERYEIDTLKDIANILNKYIIETTILNS